MRNFVQPGDNIDLVAPRALSSGAGVLVGSIFGVASTDASNGATVTAVVRGVFDLPKAAGAVTQGQLLYWDNTNFVLTTTAGSNKLIGAATQAAASADATARVRLTGQVS